MAISGDLQTMSLPDLLQWASVNRKTGVLELERDKICKRITLLDGRIIGCSSEDPPALLGQALLSRGKIVRDQLRTALARQEQTGEYLGVILCDMGLSTPDEIKRQIAANGEEIIYGMFDWTDAVFRFDENAEKDTHALQLNFGVEDILLEGVHRCDELQRFRRVFTHPEIVLARTDKPSPAELGASPMARRVLDSVDGVRSLAGILLHAHASEYKVMKLLYLLYRHEVVDIVEAVAARTPAPEPIAPAGVTVDAAPPVAGSKTIPAASTAELTAQIESAHWLTAQGEYRKALETLNGCLARHPVDSYLRALVDKAERAYLDHATEQGLSRSSLPVPRTTAGASGVELDPVEKFLLGMMDGRNDVKTMLWVAPMREETVLIALQRMRERDIIGLVERRATEEPSSAKQETRD